MDLKINNNFIINMNLNDREIKFIYYIHNLLNNEKMEYIFIDEKKYVWLRNDKILKDNPTFQIKTRSLLSLIKKLEEKNIILKVCKCIKGTSKKRTYFSINYDFIRQSLEKTKKYIVSQMDVDEIFKNINKAELKIIENNISEYLSCLDNFVDTILLSSTKKEFSKDVEKYYERNKQTFEFIYKNIIKQKINDIGYGYYLTTPLWNYNRKKFIENREKKCEICYEKEKLEVHHLSYKNIGFEKDEDLSLLCNDCHSHIHKIKYIMRKD